MPRLPDFTDGFVAENILRGLRNCDAATLRQLKNENYIKPTSIFPALEYRSLLYKGLERYADAAELPLCYFFFGTLTPPVPTYTPFDAVVIALLNGMTDVQLSATKEAVELYFPHPLAHDDTVGPDKRYIRLLSRRLYGELTASSVAPYKKFEQDIYPSLQRYAAHNIKWFPTDLYPDLATFAGVSLHWIFDCREHPLFCNSQVADELFDRYTLLQPEQWKQFIKLIQYIMCGDISSYIDMK